jgi:hypothetical protein
MSDPNVDPGRPVPTISESDTSAATDTAAAGQGMPPVPPVATTAVASAGDDPTPYTVDPALKSAKGDKHIWAAELAEMIGHSTGTWIAPETFEPWFASFHDQVTVATTRSIAFQVANTQIGDVFDDSTDSGTLLLDLRTELTNQIRKRVGI